MSIDADIFSGKEKPPLTRADVEKRLELARNSSEKLTLIRENISGSDLSTLDLRGTNLSSANLTLSNLTEANLIGADLTEADLTGADLRRANLTLANLAGANLTLADLRGADLRGADLRRANLTGANLTGANLAGADLAGADLTGADLTGANLAGADLAGADLRRANLTGANLTGANLAGANLTGANLTGANLTGANLTGADLSNAGFNRTHFDTIQFYGVNLIPTSSRNREDPNRMVRPFAFGIRLEEEPLTPYHLSAVLTTITEVSVKCWLIGQQRLADLIEYTQTRDLRFAEESQLLFTTLTYNSPFEGKFDITVTASLTNIADGIVTVLDGAIQAKQRLQKAELENWEKAQQIGQSLQKADQDEKRFQLELEKQELALERERLEILEKRLELQKKGIEYALAVAEKTVTVLYPQANEETKAMLMRTLLPNILQLQETKGLELILPPSPEKTEQ